MDRKEEFLKPGERLDDLQNGYWMIQNPSLFCYGIDAVLLASYAKVKRGERAMDFCTGSGIVPILLKAKTNGEHFSGLEIQEYSAEMAQRSVRYNHLENDVEIFQGDVKTASQQFGKVNTMIFTSGRKERRSSRQKAAEHSLEEAPGNGCRRFRNIIITVSV